MGSPRFNAVIRIGLSCLIVALASLATATSAQAVPILSIDLKASSSQFQSGKLATVPVVVTESRSVGDESQFKGHTLKGIVFDLESLNSKLVSFKPVKGFGSKFDEVLILPNGHNLYVRLQSDREGLPIRVDNTGVMGRTEIKVGTLKVKPGPAIKNRGKKLVFETTVEADPSGFFSNVTLGIPGMPSYSQNLGGIAKRTISYYEGDDDPKNKCREAKEQVKNAKNYNAFAKSAAQRAARAAKKDPALKPQAKEAAAFAKQAAKSLKKAKAAKRKSCKKK